MHISIYDLKAYDILYGEKLSELERFIETARVPGSMSYPEFIGYVIACTRGLRKTHTVMHRHIGEEDRAFTAWADEEERSSVRQIDIEDFTRRVA